MKENFQIQKDDWHKTLLNLTSSFNVYAPANGGKSIEYELINPDFKGEIIYNIPKPATPLKGFMLPVKENVVIEKKIHKKNIIIGIPSCDLNGLNLLDEIYLDKDFNDPFYRKNRENSILVGTDCFSSNEHCHCTSYGINPYPEVNHDISIVAVNGSIIMFVNSEKGEELADKIKAECSVQEVNPEYLKLVEKNRKKVVEELNKKNKNLPDYKVTGKIVTKLKDEVWEEHSKTCVSCGACATSCPTCTCFLLIDKENFEKVRQLDACQYPGFERIAAGEDPLKRKYVRFRNRYMCKFVWKPESFKSIACTGCGRCIESCIGAINKNELFIKQTS